MLVIEISSKKTRHFLCRYSQVQKCLVINVLSSMSSDISSSHQRPLRGEVLAWHNNAKSKAMTSIVLDGNFLKRKICCELFTKDLFKHAVWWHVKIVEKNISIAHRSRSMSVFFSSLWLCAVVFALWRLDGWCWLRPVKRWVCPICKPGCSVGCGRNKHGCSRQRGTSRHGQLGSHPSFHNDTTNF